MEVSITHDTNSEVSKELSSAAPPFWRHTLLRLLRRRPSLIAIIILLLLVFTSLLAPVLSPYDPEEMHAGSMLAAPSSTYLLGTDETGRDLFSRLLYGGGTSLAMAGAAVFVAMIIGTVMGLISGYHGGLWDVVIMRFIDALMAFPWLLLAILIAFVLGPGFRNTVIAIAVTGIPSITRMTRASVLVERSKEYVLAAQVVGANQFRIITKHIFRNIVPTFLVMASITAANSILTEATIGFLGLGVQPPHSSWGLILRRGYSHFTLAPWYISSVAIVVMLTIWSFNTLGDGLREVLDPRSGIVR